MSVTVVHTTSIVYSGDEIELGRYRVRGEGIATQVHLNDRLFYHTVNAQSGDTAVRENVQPQMSKRSVRRHFEMFLTRVRVTGVQLLRRNQDRPVLQLRTTIINRQIKQGKIAEKNNSYCHQITYTHRVVKCF